MRLGRSLALPVKREGGWAAALLADVPVDPCVVGLSPHPDQVDAAAPGQVGRRQVLHRDAATLDDLPCPLRALLVLRLVDADAAPFGRVLGVEVVADADDQLVAAVPVEVGAPDGV